MKKLLIHSCTIARAEITDRDGNQTYTETELTGVRITPVFETAKSTEGETKADKLTLYFSPTLSSPAGFVPAELDRVTWNGAAYTIRAVTPCYTKGNATVHHYEAALV